MFLLVDVMKQQGKNRCHGECKQHIRMEIIDVISKIILFAILVSLIARSSLNKFQLLYRISRTWRIMYIYKIYKQMFRMLENKMCTNNEHSNLTHKLWGKERLTWAGFINDFNPPSRCSFIRSEDIENIYKSNGNYHWGSLHKEPSIHCALTYLLFICLITALSERKLVWLCSSSSEPMSDVYDHHVQACYCLYIIRRVYCAVRKTKLHLQHFSVLENINASSKHVLGKVTVQFAIALIVKVLQI